jgi:hypothetical protein
MDSVRVVGLTHLEGLELKKHHPEASISFEPGAASGPQHGELATAALIALTVAGLNVLAVWLLKNREAGKIEHTLEIVGADGSRRTERFFMQTSASTSQADVVKALAPKIGVDLSALGP